LQRYSKDRTTDQEMFANSSKDIYNITKRLRTPDEVEKYFPAFLLLSMPQNNRYQDLLIRIEEKDVLFR